MRCKQCQEEQQLPGYSDIEKFIEKLVILLEVYKLVKEEFDKYGIKIYRYNVSSRITSGDPPHFGLVLWIYHDEVSNESLNISREEYKEFVHELRILGVIFGGMLGETYINTLRL